MKKTDVKLAEVVPSEELVPEVAVIEEVEAESQEVTIEEVTIEDVAVEEVTAPDEAPVEVKSEARPDTTQIDNHFADLLFASRDLRLSNAFDIVLVTADSKYIGDRAKFLLSIANDMAKVGGKIKVAKEYFTIHTAPAGSVEEELFWTITK